MNVCISPGGFFFYSRSGVLLLHASETLFVTISSLFFLACESLDPPEKVSLQIMSEGPIVEGENVTLKCQADGNPAPTSFYFHFKVSQKPEILQDKLPA